MYRALHRALYQALCRALCRALHRARHLRVDLSAKHVAVSADPSASAHASAAGRSCPLHYRYAPDAFAVPAEAACEVLYVVGGLYGNEPALDAVLALFARETGRKRLVFNGDFHWFDADAALFRRIDERVMAFDALRGNVETELASAAAADDDADDRGAADADDGGAADADDGGAADADGGGAADADDGGAAAADGGDAADAGCGCAYPAWVGDDVVERSNRILQRLRRAARTWPERLPALAALPMWRRVDVGPLRVGIVHGDAESLAGWGFAQEQLRDAAHRARVRAWFEAAQVDAFACSHTCLPIFHAFGAGGPLVLNNGAAGMPNFAGDPAGLLTRIALRPFTGPERRHGMRRGAVHIDAIAVGYDTRRFEAQFMRQWPPGSDAHASYWQRITHGPAYAPPQALFTTED